MKSVCTQSIIYLKPSCSVVAIISALLIQWIINLAVDGDTKEFQLTESRRNSSTEFNKQILVQYKISLSYERVKL